MTAAIQSPMATGWALIRCSCGCGSAYLLLTDRAGAGLALLPVTAESLRRIADAVNESAPDRPDLAEMRTVGRA
ncbi:hypothetical protein ACQVP2_22560 [Methylobacterium aquaticum]|uniref:hypothetical protein n=1 Tax=Methylobacterium aquaticum TaxID=270351 RepID=UPI003D16D06A